MGLIYNRNVQSYWPNPRIIIAIIASSAFVIMFTGIALDNYLLIFIAGVHFLILCVTILVLACMDVLEIKRDEEFELGRQLLYSEICYRPLQRLSIYTDLIVIKRGKIVIIKPEMIRCYRIKKRFILWNELCIDHSVNGERQLDKVLVKYAEKINNALATYDLPTETHGSITMSYNNGEPDSSLKTK